MARFFGFGSAAEAESTPTIPPTAAEGAQISTDRPSRTLPSGVGPAWLQGLTAREPQNPDELLSRVSSVDADLEAATVARWLSTVPLREFYHPTMTTKTTMVHDEHSYYADRYPALDQQRAMIRRPELVVSLMEAFDGPQHEIRRADLKAQLYLSVGNRYDEYINLLLKDFGLSWRYQDEELPKTIAFFRAVMQRGVVRTQDKALIKDIFFGGLLLSISESPEMSFEPRFPESRGHLAYDYKAIPISSCNPDLVVHGSNRRYIVTIENRIYGYGLSTLTTLMQRYAEFVTLEDFQLLLSHASHSEMGKGTIDKRKEALIAVIAASNQIPEEQHGDYISKVHDEVRSRRLS